MVYIRSPKQNEYSQVYNLTLSHLTHEKQESYEQVNPAAVARTKRIISGETGICNIAIAKNDEIIGYILGDVKPTPLTSIIYAEILDIKVVEGSRNNGIGTRLVQEFFQWSKEHADRVSVTVHHNNSEAIRFYEKSGLTPQSLEMEMRLE